MARRSFLVIALGVLLAISLVACGGGSNTTSSSAAGAPLKAGPWVSQLCAFGTTVMDKIKARTSQVQSATPASIDEAKQNLVDYLTFVRQQFGALEGKVKQLGVPDVNDGKAAYDKIVTLFDQANAEFDSAVTKSKALPTGDATAFENGANEIGNDIQNAPIFANNSNLNFQQADLDKAYNADPACRAFEGAASSP